MKVELIYDQSCPNVALTRANLLRAFSKTGLPATWQEWDKGSSEAPARIQAYGSPTLLINDRDLVGVSGNSNGDCCRIYSGSGVPSVELIAKALSFNDKKNDGKGVGILGALATAPGAGAAFLAKAACPFCYPAVAGLLSSMGLGFLFQDTPLIVLTSLATAMVLFGLGFRAKSRHGYGPLCLGLIGVILGGYSNYQGIDTLFYSATAIIVIACIWNLVPRRSCGNCVTTEAHNPSSAQQENTYVHETKD